MKLAFAAFLLLSVLEGVASPCSPGGQPALSIVSGNGQLVRGQAYSAPLVVALVDNCGKPVANASVTWTTSNSIMKSPVTATDGSGHATDQWLAPQILIGWATWASGTVTAAVSGANVTFYETAYYLDSQTSIPSVGAKLIAPVLGQVLSGDAGGTTDGAVQMSVVGQVGIQTGQPVPNVQVTAFSNAGASVLQGSALTDASGTVSFMPALSGQPGPVSPFMIDVGELFEFSQGLQFQITGILLTDQVFVTQLYQDLLFRPPDAGLTYWLTELGNGSMTRATVAADFFTSAEFAANSEFVYDLYQGLLGRDADFAGWQYWAGQMEAGTADQSSIIDTFLASAEYARSFGANPDNTEFVTNLYQTALQRAPDPAGLSFWVDELNSGVMTRAQVVESFIGGQEFQARLRNRADVFLIYFGFLRREPDAAGESYWLGQLNAGLPLTSAINAFITSPEYLARF